MRKNSRSRRRPPSIRVLEPLESRRLLAANTCDYWPNVLTTDSSPTAATVSPGNTTSYSLRELVQYYNQNYDDSEPFQIVLAASTTYTLSESQNSGSIWGGRLNNSNEYGALDVDPVYPTAGPLEIIGAGTSEITCSIVSSNNGTAPLDRLFHVISGSLDIQDTELFRGLALDNGTGIQGTDAEGGGVLINPGAKLSVTSCKFQSCAASGTASGDRDGGHNAAGGGIYASAGSSLNINGLTSFVNSRLIAGRGANGVDIGSQGGSAFGAGVAMSAPVSGLANTTGSAGTMTFISNANGAAEFTGGRINSEVTYSGKVKTIGGTGGSGAQTGGAGGNAYGGGLYIGASSIASPQQPTLVLSGLTSITFADNQITGGPPDNHGGPPNAGLDGSSYGAGAYIEPASVSVTNGPTTNGIFTFTDNTETSYMGGYSGDTLVTTSATDGLDLPSVNPSSAATAATTPWSLVNAVSAVNPLIATGMTISLNIGPQFATSGFEDPTLNTKSYENYGGQTKEDWTYSGNAGISSNDSSLNDDNPAAPQGTQVASLAETGSISQTVEGFVPGESYSISFDAAQRSGFPDLSINITVDGISIGTFAPTSTAYQTITTPAFIATSGYQTFTFTGIDPDDINQSVFLDNIQILASTVASYSGNVTITDSGSGKLSLIGAGVSSTLITGADSTSVFTLEHGAHVAFLSLSMEDGAASNGGGINASSASITFTNDSITGNKSTGNGGGIYQTGGTLAINNSVLSENTVSGNGGDLSVQNADVTIENAVIETGTASQDGGGIDQTDGTLTISNNTAVNQNNATSGAGMFLTDCTFSMTDGQLDTNKASESGGAADISGSSSTTCFLSSVTVSYNTITDSSGTGAGILAIDVPLLIGDCTFTKDVATGNGGAILATGSSTLQINGGSISGNQASDGAGIFMQKSNSKEPSAFISDVTISNNTASQSGGGIYAATIAEFSIVSAVLKSNTASMSSGSGGGIFLSGGSLLVAGTTITSNQAFQGGGAYFNNGVATLKEDSVVSSNTAVADGGGLFSSNSTLDLNDAAISHNSANTTLETPSYGGGVYQAGGGSLDVSNHAKVTHNAASYGGGILCNNAAFILNSSVIEANTATIEGAGFCSTTNSKAMSITNGTISGNAIDATGAASGAGLFLSGSGALNTNGLIVTKNSITESGDETIEGAGIYASGTPITFNGGSTSTAVSLAAYFNRIAIVANGTTFSGGGADDDGNAYSSNLLGSTLTGLGTFDLGTANQPNSVDAQGQTITVPSGTYTSVNLAATAVNGAQNYLEFILHFSNGTSETVSQSFSDWCGSSESSNESVLSSMDYRDTSSGGTNIQTPHVYGYSFAIPTGDVLSSITLPSNSDLIVLAMNVSTSSASTTISSNSLENKGGGDAYGGAIYAGPNSSITSQATLALINNAVESAAIGLGGAIAFESGTSYAANYLVTCTGNSASDGGIDYAFVLPNQSGDSYSGSEDGPSGINYFTSGQGSLYSAVQFVENWMNGNVNNSSTAIMLSSSDSLGNYLLDYYGTGMSVSFPLTTSIASGNTLTIIGTNGQAAIQGWHTTTVDVENAGTLALQNLEITGGDTTGSGGGIYETSGTLTLDDVTVTDNLAGAPQTTATPNYLAGKPTAASGHVGADGGNGSTFEGGGIYLSGGTLNLLSNDSITDNTVYGQNGGAGQNGGGGHDKRTAWGGSACTVEPQNGGNGGNGGSALGGGMYQAGGTINVPASDVGALLSDNHATAGNGGDAGAAGKSCPHADGDSNGKGGSQGKSVSSFSHSGGSVLSSSSTSAALVAPAGRYSSGGTLNSSAVGLSTATLNPLAKIEVQLYAADGALVATTYTGLDGRYHVDTSFSGLGYIEVNTSPIFQFASQRSISNDDGITLLDSTLGRFPVVQFLDGVALNQSLDVVLQLSPAKTQISDKSVAVVDTALHQKLWTARLMPRSYTGGFTVTELDVNGDGTPDYLLASKKGPTIFFIVNGRTGAVTRIRGAVDPAFRYQFKVQSGQFIKGEGTQLLVSEPNDETGAAMLIDMNTRRVVWSVRYKLPGASSYRSVAAVESGRSGLSDVELYNKSAPFDYIVLDGRNGHIFRMGAGRVSHSPRTSSRAKLRFLSERHRHQELLTE